MSIESYGRQAAALAAELGCDAVVGHSIGANVALEMVLAGGFAGSVVLLSGNVPFSTQVVSVYIFGEVEQGSTGSAAIISRVTSWSTFEVCDCTKGAVATTSICSD